MHNVINDRRSKKYFRVAPGFAASPCGAGEAA